MVGDDTWFATAPIGTPAGVFGAVFTARGLACLTLPGEPRQRQVMWARRQLKHLRQVAAGNLPERLEAELNDYFAGSLTTFSIALDPRGTPFQQRVWQAVYEVGYGKVSTYAQVAHAIGRPAAVRAVGAANGANPIAILIPCHRLVGVDGSLRGYGGGLPFKQMLLQLEGHPRSDPQPNLH
jgi:methylated-DNA-[protein]-cysteine S-methyltransferase